ncbi:MAG: hypothetical protein U5K33_04745 [Halofilum sp. (in: g-proteobacteria)]|nr:hypothetical protein [Halofilum sp. (in: g-proteobacteria)]
MRHHRPAGDQRRRDREARGAGQCARADEFRELDVVADQHADAVAGQIERRDGIAAGVGRLLVGTRQPQLAVVGEDFSVGAEDQRGIVDDAVGRLRVAEHDRDAAPARDPGSAATGRAVGRFRAGMDSLRHAAIARQEYFRCNQQVCTPGDRPGGRVVQPIESCVDRLVTCLALEHCQRQRCRCGHGISPW